MFGAVILEEPPDVLHQGDGVQVRQEDRNAYRAGDEIEQKRLLLDPEHHCRDEQRKKEKNADANRERNNEGCSER